MVEFGSDLWRTIWFKPMLKQGHLELTAPDHVKMAFEYLQGGRLHNLPGQCVSAWSHSKRVFSEAQVEPPVFQFVPIAFGPVS